MMKLYGSLYYINSDNKNWGNDLRQMWMNVQARILVQLITNALTTSDRSSASAPGGVTLGTNLPMMGLSVRVIQLSLFQLKSHVNHLIWIHTFGVVIYYFAILWGLVIFKYWSIDSLTIIKRTWLDFIYVSGFLSWCVTWIEDIDECGRGIHECKRNQICQNRRGGYVCVCPQGFTIGADGDCQDVDECVRFAGQVIHSC